MQAALFLSPPVHPLPWGGEGVVDDQWRRDATRRRCSLNYDAALISEIRDIPWWVRVGGFGGRI